MAKHKGPICRELEPDCLNCPFDDCIASEKTIRKQLAYEKKQEYLSKLKEIYDFQDEENLSVKDLAERFGLSASAMYKILRKGRKQNEQK